MKKKYSRILGVTLALMLLASLFGFATPVSASDMAWSTIGVPEDPDDVDDHLTNCDVGPIAVTPDGGTIFAPIQAEEDIDEVADEDNYALLQSTDGGYTWTPTGLVNQPGIILGVAISPNFATDGTMYVASGDTVFRSTDKGATFIALKPIADSDGSAATIINSIAMWPGTPAYVMVGTDVDVLVLRDSVFENWRDQELAPPPTNTVAEAVAFAPDFATSNYIWAVTEEGRVKATNSPGAWGTILADTDPLIDTDVVNASIAFPGDYSSATAPYLWVGIDSGAENDGGVYRVRGLPVPGPSQAVPQYGDVAAVTSDVRSLAASGPMATATIIAGLQDQATVVKSTSGGLTWVAPVLKWPTGGGAVFVAMAPDFATSDTPTAYLGNSGEESAFHVSQDGGMTWNQTGLIDTDFDEINDIAVVSKDDIFVVSDNYSLWKITGASYYRTRKWERILTKDTVTIPGNVLDNISIVEISPDFLDDGVLYATDDDTGIMKAVDGGSVFAPMGAPGAGPITAMHVVDATYAFIGSTGQVYRTDDGGYSWLPATTPPGGTVRSIALAPNYDTSGHMLVGCSMGWVYQSLDRGVTWAMVPGAPPVDLGFFTSKYVAYEPTYTGSGHPGPGNRGIYAAGENLIMRYYTPAVGWEIIHTGPTAEAAGAPVAADEFTITGAGDDAGTITVLTGSVRVTPTGTATIAGVVEPGTLTITAGMGAIAYTVADGDTLVVTALSDGTSGTFTTGAATTTADITTDVDGDATCGAGGAAGTYPFSLPDAEVAAVPGVADSEFNGLVMSADGTLYASNALEGMGVERSLNPTASAPSVYLTGPAEGTTAPVFETMNQQIEDDATLQGLWLVVDGSSKVFHSIDTTGTKILTYTDTLAAPVSGVAGTPGQTTAKISWEALTGARAYSVIVDDDARCTADAAGVVHAIDAADREDAVTGLAAGRTYYTKVRATSPLLSRYSDVVSFTTSLGTAALTVDLSAPAPGATDVSVTPNFQWQPIAGATSYEIEVATDSAFTSVVASASPTTNVWACDTTLNYSTTYYWRVKAAQGRWTTGVFTTMAEPVEAPPPVTVEEVPPPEITVEVPPAEVPPTPGYVWAIIGIGAVLVIVVIVLIVRTRRPL